ncbi:haloacid dehalogenase-like hydrolase [Kineococcus sp. SYSU DK005]|uniref:haloacid dehalogenase-like hydrolase n=1 Tax=Kineococcus sp. SYSU DK005 TaxID=3383126 RepID=UPI003D7E894D
MSQQQCVVFDLDDTLLSTDSFARFLTHLLRRSPARLALVALTAPAWLTLGARRTSRLHAERIVVWAATVGLHPTCFQELMCGFAAEHAGPGGGRRIDLALARLHEHRAAGDRVVIATGCAQPLALALCDALGLEDVEVVASAFTAHRWRLPHAVPARGQAKVHALLAAGVELPVEHAYSDNLTDLPLLRAARTAHLVRPRARELPALLEALGEDVEVLR